MADAPIEMRWAGRSNGAALTRSQVSSATAAARAGPRTPASTPLRTTHHEMPHDTSREEWQAAHDAQRHRGARSSLIGAEFVAPVSQ